MRAFALAALMSTGLLVAAGPTPPTSAPTAPAGVTIRQLSFAGSGCPASSVTGNFPTDPGSFLIFLTSFTAAAGDGVPILAGRTNCQINLDLAYPAGWQYTIASVQYQGHVTVADGTTASARSAYYFQGSADTLRFASLFDGPANRDFYLTDSQGPQSQLWSSCDASRSLNLNLEVRVTPTNTGGTATGTITFGQPPHADGTGGEAGTLLTLAWRQCAAGT